MTAVLLDADVLISTPEGPLHLNEPPYELASDTFNSIGITHRRQEATNAFIEGTYTVNSVRENLSMPLSVWVRGKTQKEFQAAIKKLCDAFDQSTFEVRRIIEEDQVDWQCFSSDYTINLQREFLHAKTARVDAQLVVHPGARAWSNQSSGLG